MTDGSPRGDIVVLSADEETIDILALWLNAAGHVVMVAQDGHQASRLLRDGSCRLLITDRVLPPWPGLDTFLSLRSRDPRLAIVVIENGNVDERILARVTGATALLSKPLSRAAVLGLLSGAQPLAREIHAESQSQPTEKPPSQAERRRPSGTRG